MHTTKPVTNFRYDFFHTFFKEKFIRNVPCVAAGAFFMPIYLILFLNKPSLIETTSYFLSIFLFIMVGFAGWKMKETNFSTLIFSMLIGSFLFNLCFHNLVHFHGVDGDAMILVKYMFLSFIFSFTIMLVATILFWTPTLIFKIFSNMTGIFNSNLTFTANMFSMFLLITFWIAILFCF